MNLLPWVQLSSLKGFWQSAKLAFTIGKVFQKATGRPSARLDVPKDDVSPLTLLPQGVKEIVTITEEFQLREPEYKNLAKEIFGPLIR